MIKNFGDLAGFQDGCDDFHIRATLRAVFNIDTNTRLSRRAQLMRTEVVDFGTSSLVSVGLLLFSFSPGMIWARNLAFGTSTP